MLTTREPQLVRLFGHGTLPSGRQKASHHSPSKLPVDKSRSSRSQQFVPVLLRGFSSHSVHKSPLTKKSLHTVSCLFCFGQVSTTTTTAGILNHYRAPEASIKTASMADRDPSPRDGTTEMNSSVHRCDSADHQLLRDRHAIPASILFRQTGRPEHVPRFRYHHQPLMSVDQGILGIDAHEEFQAYCAQNSDDSPSDASSVQEGYIENVSEPIMLKHPRDMSPSSQTLHRRRFRAKREAKKQGKKQVRRQRLAEKRKGIVFDRDDGVLVFEEDMVAAFVMAKDSVSLAEDATEEIRRQGSWSQPIAEFVGSFPRKLSSFWVRKKSRETLPVCDESNRTARTRANAIQEDAELQFPVYDFSASSNSAREEQAFEDADTIAPDAVEPDGASLRRCGRNGERGRASFTYTKSEYSEPSSPHSLMSEPPPPYSPREEGNGYHPGLSAQREASDAERLAVCILRVSHLVRDGEFDDGVRQAYFDEFPGNRTRTTEYEQAVASEILRLEVDAEQHRRDAEFRLAEAEREAKRLARERKLSWFLPRSTAARVGQMQTFRLLRSASVPVLPKKAHVRDEFDDDGDDNDAVTEAVRLVALHSERARSFVGFT
ncbi:hypothetical protein BAUCODRAFT_230593 [Baudoinia panamericana UAMH 10762]|uniref:Uncharacterized protein n=1 Tax=Baudoinia panamericana (strain UAMH 10762) TaxID=717646 RepID=M2N2H8_BAUPA|nr:uncharacterized protein BAUCODRAFT_230593 [Baudoinia panamericana UAMH 10762]EMC93184.1 hypothetical protein BAUCODRAFT_230593 [Baudoinia panamericana UAMH 10762]